MSFRDEDPSLPVTQQWFRSCFSGLLVTFKRIDFSHKITQSCLLSVLFCFGFFNLLFSYFLVCVSNVIREGLAL